VSDPASTRSRSSARLGLVLRAVILMPAEGFDAAARAAERRERAGQRPAEGSTPYVLAAIGGAALFLLWLKLGALIELRDAPSASFRPAYLAGVVVLGAVLGLFGQVVWGWLGSRLFGVSGPGARRSMRTMWGLASLPQVVSLLVLFPMDLAIVGPQSFTTSGLPDSVSTAWAAASIALAMAVGAWTVFLFFKGMQVTVETGRWRAAAGLLAGGLLVSALYAPLLLAGRFS
jgi:hypothetical protein